jgi:PAS domain S-box-containing protein
MPRKPLLLALLIVALHVCEALTLGTSALGTFLANCLQISACAFAAVMAYRAHRRGQGLSRPFWLLVTISFVIWTVANIGWMYHEFAWHTPPSPTSIVRILFGMQNMFLAMALFLDHEKDSSELDAESILDFIQIAIVFFLIHLEFYYLPARRFAASAAMLRAVQVKTAEDLLLIALALLQAIRARAPHIRKLYVGLAVYLLAFSAGPSFAAYVQSVRPSPTGTFLDLAWTLPLLVGALWAAQWRPHPVAQPTVWLRQKTFGQLMLTNATLALGPLIVLLQISQIGSEWRLVRFSLLGISILCFAARLGLSEFRFAQSSDVTQQHTLAMEAAADGISILKAPGEVVYANSAFARMLAFEHPRLLLGKTWREIYDHRDVALLEEQVREVLAKSGKWSGQVSLRRRDGSRIPIEMTITVMPQGGTVCVARDITERLATERARTETETKYRTLIEQVAAVSYIAELGLHGQWHYVSPQVESIFGYTPDEWLYGSAQWIRFIPEEDHPIIKAAEEACFTARRFQAEYRIVRKDGQVIWVSDTAVVVPGSDNHPLMEGIIVDITERKALENQLQQARRMEAVGRLAGGIAHDFNNLLTIIKGYVEMATNRAASQPELRGDLQHIGDASERAGSLVRQLLAFSRKQVLKPKVLDLNSIVLNLDKLLRRLLAEVIEMKTIVGKNIGAVKADPGQIEQVIMNLVVNARDAMPKGGRILIETANVELDETYAQDHATVRPGRYVMLAVTDTGIGMAADTVAHIFEPFYTTKESGRGTGLGLSTVYGIVKQSGGYIWVYSEPGKGTSFKVYLPRVDDRVEVPSTVETPVVPARHGNETVLLVEDEPAVRELTHMVLADRGYSILEALNPQDAERLAGSHPGEIHLLLTDVVMPGISGRELAKRLTARHPHLRVLYMSGYTYNVIAEDGTLEEGISFLQKPFTPQALTQKVRETLDRAVPAK